MTRIVEDNPRKSHAKKSVELFTGAGGLALATHRAGFKHVGLFEWNVNACDTIRENAQQSAVPGLNTWRGKITQGDVRDISFSQFDGVHLVAGGPPCQPFSLGGKHQGMEDSRDMIPQFIRAVREARPSAFIMENVRGLTRKSFSTYLSYSILQLTYPELVRKQGEDWEPHLMRLQQHHTSKPRSNGLSYNVVFQTLNAADYGVPQCRERIFVVGFRSDIDARWSFPTPTHSQDSLIYDQQITGEYWDVVGQLPAKLQPQVLRRLASIKSCDKPRLKPWKTVRQAISDLPEPFLEFDTSGGIFNHRMQLGAKPYVGHTGSWIDAPSKTLKAGDHGVPGGENMIDFGDGRYRYFSVREAARIQTFPDAWHFKGAWSEAMRQLGNAVPVELAQVVAKSVAKTLDARFSN